MKKINLNELILQNLWDLNKIPTTTNSSEEFDQTKPDGFFMRRIQLRANHRQKRIAGKNAIGPEIEHKKHKTSVVEEENMILTFKDNGTSAKNQVGRWLSSEIRFLESLNGNDAKLGE